MEYDMHRIEAYWQNQWKEKNIFSVEVDTSKPKFD